MLTIRCSPHRHVVAHPGTAPGGGFSRPCKGPRSLRVYYAGAESFILASAGRLPSGRLSTLFRLGVVGSPGLEPGTGESDSLRLPIAPTSHNPPQWRDPLLELHWIGAFLSRALGSYSSLVTTRSAVGSNRVTRAGVEPAFPSSCSRLTRRLSASGTVVGYFASRAGSPRPSLYPNPVSPSVKPLCGN